MVRRPSLSLHWTGHAAHPDLRFVGFLRRRGRSAWLPGGPENFGYMIATAVAETEEKAQQVASGFVYGGGQNAFSAPQFTMPPGYNSKAAIRIMAKQQSSAWLGISGEKVREQMHGAQAEMDYAEVRRKLQAALVRGQRNLQVIVGTPATILPKIKGIMS